MLTIHDLLLGVLLPALIAGVVLLLARRSAAGWPGALALGGGSIAAHIGLRGWRGWVPQDSTDWILLLTAASMLLAVLLCAGGEMRPRSRVPRAGLMVVLATAAAFCLQRRVAGGAQGPLDVLLPALGAGALVALFWESAQDGLWLARAELPCVLLIASVGVAVTVGLSGSVSLAQLAGAVAACLGAALVAALLGLAPTRLDGAVAVCSLVLGSIALAASLFADLPPRCAVLIAIGPTAYLIVRRAAGVFAVRGKGALLLALIAQLALVGWAVRLAFLASPSLEGL